MSGKLLSRKKAFIGVLIATSAYSAVIEAKNYDWQLSAPGVRAEEKNTLGDIQFYFDKSVYHGAERPVLSWNVGGNPKTISIDKGIGNVAKTGNMSINSPVAGINTYTLTESIEKGSKTATASFEFLPYEFGSIELTFDKEFYSYEEVPVLSWNVGGYPMSIYIDHGIGEVPASGKSNITNATPGNNVYSLTVSNDGESKQASASYVMGKGSYLSCNDIKKTIGEFASDGVYLVDPDGTGGNAPFNAYCNMTVEGGGWGLAYKQHGFSSGSMLVNYPAGAGTAAYLNPASTVSTPSGSIASKLTGTEYMLYNSATKYLVFGSSLNSLVSSSNCYSGAFCIKIKPNAKVIKGYGTGDGLSVVLRNAPSMSSVLVGYYNKVGVENQPWCAIVDGRYNGACINGNIGQGNWILYVR